MPTKIRLQRFGKKGQPFYHVVVADSRAPRDGKFIEKLGVYNPRTNPATIDLNLERALHWVRTGAQPTDTTRAILSYKGVIYKNHLQKGVDKGALSQEQADSKFNSWMESKNLKVLQKAQNIQTSKADDVKNRLSEEAKKRDAIAKAIAEKRAATNVAAAESIAETGEGAAPAEETSSENA
jgi:small subunit ribosomal protein S16